MHYFENSRRATLVQQLYAIDNPLKFKSYGYRQLYDVTLTPTIYLLDKEKRIIAKKLTWQQLDDLLQVKWKMKSN